MRRLLTIATIVAIATTCVAKEGDDHGNHGALKPWFDQLASKKGLCCSFADGLALKDVDVDTKDGHWRVKIAAGAITSIVSGEETYTTEKKPEQDQWVDVPDAAVITEPNRYGAAVVWPYYDAYNGIQIRCFMPGAGT